MWEYVITVTPRQRDVAHCVRGRRRGKKRRMRRGLNARRGGAGRGRRRRGDTYVARARERVCVRLINQTFAFGCRGMRWRRGRKRSRRREKQAAVEARQGRARGRAGPSKVRLSLSLSLRHAGPSSNLCYPHSGSPSSLSPSRAISVSLLRARPSVPLAPSTDPQSHSRGVLSPSACLPACLPLPVGRLGPAFPPATPCSDSRALSPPLPPYLSPAAAMYRWHGESTHQSADCGLLNARSHDPASGDVYTG